jgi:hypothetical protein
MTTPSTARTSIHRMAYATLAAVLLAAIVFETVKHATGYWQIAAFALGPDLALLFGAGEGLERGQLHPRAVPLYNLAHRFWGPIVLAALATLDVVSIGYFIGALAWALHIAVDRSLGYGLRTRDGFQRH